MQLDKLAARMTLLSPANRAIVERLIDALSGTSGAYEPFDPRQARHDWIDYLLARHLSPGTIAYYRQAVDAFCSNFPDPSPAHLDAFVALLPPTVRHRYIAALRNFFAFCQDRGYLPNIASHLKNPYTPNRRQPASQDTIEKLLALELTPRDRCLLVLFTETGIRLNELTTLELRNINDQAITVVAKRNKARTILLTPFAKDAVAGQIATLPPDARYLFHTKSGNRIDNREVQKVIGRLCKKAGVPHTTPHQFRHYWTTHLLQSGASLKAVSQILGHASISTTANIYWHLCESDALQEALQHSPSKTLLAPRQASFEDMNP